MDKTKAATLADVAAATRRDRALIASYRGGSDMDQPGGDQLSALVDAVQALESTGLSFALIGGIAVGIQSGMPRATMDVDFAVSSRADRKTLVRDLIAAGFTLTGEFEHSVNLRHSTGEPIQLAFDPQFDPMIDRAERFQMGSVFIPIVSKTDLIAMKELAAGDPSRRPSKALRDRADVELLRGETPDPDEGW